MGIPVFFKTLIEDYNHICYNQNKNICIDNLYFDLNCLIHPCCRNLTDETEMHKKILESIHKIIDIVKPNEMVYIAIDGPCPKPKMIQQRLRRYKSAKEKKIWDTNAITPGTKFMENLENYLLQNIHIDQKLIFDSSNTEGEGEHKIYNTIRMKHYDNNCVYGLDADLIMLSLISDSKIHLLRETTEYRIEGFNSEYVYLDISRLKNLIINNIKPRVYKLDDMTLINDYIFICFFLGNDFISHTPSINLRHDGLEVLIGTYKNLCEKNLGYYHLIDIKSDDLINISGLKEYIHTLSLNEEDRMKNILQIRDNMERKYKRIYKNTKDLVELEKLMNHKPILDRVEEKRIFYDMKYWKTNYYMKYLFDHCYSPAYDEILKCKTENMCNDYLKSLYWCVHYYFSGCIAWRYSYDYYTAPCFKELHDTIIDMDSISINRDNLPYTPNEQLSMVLPVESQHLTDIKLNVVKENIKECHILKRYDWESFPLLPHL